MGTEYWRAYLGTNDVYTPVEFEDIIFVAADDACLYALNKQTGRITWRFDAGAPLSTTPFVASDKELVFFCSKDGYLYAVGTKTGRCRWKFFTGKHLTAEPAQVSEI